MSETSKAAMRAAALIEPHDDNYCRALARGAGCNCSRPQRVQSTAMVIDRETGLPDLLRFLKEAVAAREQDGLDESDDSAAGEAMGEWKAAIAKAEGRPA